ncbi:MAG: alpha/beta fold hydrolase, partial [Hyphomicrobiales bacterium]|nr:alpha/beta fold hydrolase [Hyphomicrobiales bacterium]
IRGHGASGARGDIAYLGQLDADLADLLVQLRASYPQARLALIGHSSGGGFALRIAAEPLGGAFDKIVLLSPYLGYDAPTNRASEGVGRWAEPDVPRIIALSLLRRIGVDWAEGLPVIAFANAPEAKKYVTSRCSYRLLVNFGPPRDWAGAMKSAGSKIELIAGEKDELMDAAAYHSAVAPLGASVTLLPDIDHMGVVYAPAALAAIRAAVAR